MLEDDFGNGSLEELGLIGFGLRVNHLVHLVILRFLGGFRTGLGLIRSGC